MTTKKKDKNGIEKNSVKEKSSNKKNINNTNLKGEAEMSNKKQNNKVENSVTEGKNQNSLREGVTPEPQDQEHMHLKYIQHSPDMIDVYLAVSDDQGDLLGDKDLEQRVIEFIDQYKGRKVDDIENPQQVLEELESLYKHYSLQINKTGSIAAGTVNKYRIRQGMLLNIEKTLLKKSKKQWIHHFAQKYGQKHLRSAQDYMALARIPYSIRYAAIGKERSMEVKRAIKTLKIESDDPFATFLDRHKISYDFENAVTDESLAELKIEIDTAIAITKIKQFEQKKEFEFGIREDLIKNLTGLGINVGNGLIGELVIVKESGGDVNQHLENVYISGYERNPIVKSTKKVQGFPKLVANFKNTVDYIKEHSDLAELIERAKIDELEQTISELKSLIENRDSDN